MTDTSHCTTVIPLSHPILPTLAPGQVWEDPHCVTPEEVSKGWRPMLKGEAVEDEDQCWVGDLGARWVDSLRLNDIVNLAIGKPSWRTKRPLPPPPAPELVPLEYTDVIPGTVVRRKSSYWMQVISSCQENAKLADGNRYPWIHFQKNGWEMNRSLPLHGKWDDTAWEPMSKPKTA